MLRTTTVHRDFSHTLSCGCDHGHFCPTAEGLWREMTGWLLNPNHPTAVAITEQWNAHFEKQECTCREDRVMICPHCRAVIQQSIGDEIPVEE